MGISVITGIALSLPAAARKRYEEQTNRSEAPVTRNEAQRDAAFASDVGNVVTLKGTVDSEDAKRRAEQAAKQVEGVASVNNQLTVRATGYALPALLLGELEPMATAGCPKLKRRNAVRERA